MATTFRLLLLLFSALTVLVTATASAELKGYIIVLKDIPSEVQSANAPHRTAVGEFLRRYSSLSVSQAHQQRYNLPRVRRYTSLIVGYTALIDSVALSAMKKMTEVDYIEEDRIVYGNRTQWHLDRIDQRSLPLDGVFNSRFTGAGVDIYIVDSGIRYTHRTFGGRARFGGYDFQPSTAQGPPGSDCDGHGTHVAGLAGGVTIGPATGANLYSIRVLGCNGEGSSIGIIEGIDHVLRTANRNGRTRILSLSLGTERSPTVNRYIQMAFDRGVIPVAAAGNEEQDACVTSPASAPAAITVGASNRRDGLPLFTNYGSCVDIFAPGDQIQSASHLNDNGLTVLSGTSMATPIVSGVIAVMLQQSPLLTPQEITQAIIARSTKNVLDFVTLPSHARSNTPNRLVYLDNTAILGQSTTTADDSGNVWKTQTTSTNSFVGRFKAVLAGQARDLVRNTKN
jgi:subtilisin family serine protease